MTFISVLFALLLTAPFDVQAQGLVPETTEDGITFHASEGLRRSGFPLATAVEADGWVYLSGALGTVPGQGLVEGGIVPETQQTMSNIESTLEQLELHMGHLVKCTVFLADMAEWPAFNEVYKEYFDGNFPARSALAVSGLAANARVEVECIARR